MRHLQFNSSSVTTHIMGEGDYTLCGLSFMSAGRFNGQRVPVAHDSDQKPNCNKCGLVLAGLLAAQLKQLPTWQVEEIAHQMGYVD